MLLVLTGLCILGVAIENMSVGLVMPYVKCDLKLTVADENLLRSASFLGIISGSLFWGFLSDTWGRQKVLPVAAFGGFIFSFPFGFITNVYAAVTLRFLGGAM